MKPVEQRILYGSDGDCFAACLASILEKPLDDVPHFLGPRWRERYNDWLRPHGLAVLSMRLPPDVEELPGAVRRLLMPGYTIAATRAPCGSLHAVVCKDGEVVHDPHPLLRQLGQGKFCEVDVLVTLDPTRN